MKTLVMPKNALADARWVEAPTPVPGDGELLLEVERFALTANNVTYAGAGDSFGYWNFFPAPAFGGEESDGVVPTWGFARIVASKHADIPAGGRVYGYLPLGTHLVVAPDEGGKGGFVDTAEHRRPMAAIYNQYQLVASDSDQTIDDRRALFQPLFTTSYLLEAFFRDADWHGANGVLLTSASSKTALGLAACAKHDSPEVERIGLTSPLNRAFVKETGLYDRVVTYDEIAMMDAQQPIVSVDFAGNSKLLTDIHAHYGDALKFSSLVGATHVDARGGARSGGLAGPEPILFFAPTYAEKRMEDVGAAAFRADVDRAFDQFVRAMGDSLSIEYLSGDGTILDAWKTMHAGKVDPARGLICLPQG